MLNNENYSKLRTHFFNNILNNNLKNYKIIQNSIIKESSFYFLDKGFKIKNIFLSLYLIQKIIVEV